MLCCRTPRLLFLLLLLGFVRAEFNCCFPGPDDLVAARLDPSALLVGRVEGPPALFHPFAGREERVYLVGLERAGDRPLFGRIRLATDGREPRLRGEEQIRFRARLRPPRGFADPGVFPSERRLWARSVVAVGRVVGDIEVADPKLSLRRPLEILAKTRERIRESIDQSLSDPARAIILAMTVGDEERLTPQIRDRFMLSGATHILSISGSHLGLLALIVFAAVRFIFLRLPQRVVVPASSRLLAQQAAAAAALIAVFFYAMIAGAEVATIRSLLMIALYLTAVMIGRPNEGLNALAIAAIILLLFDPRALFDLSFQLSFLSVWAIMLTATTAQPLAERLGRWPRRGLIALLTTLSATGLTAPLVAYHFHQFSWTGLFSNFVVIPLAGMMVVPAALGSSLLLLLFGSSIFPLASLNQWGGDLFYKVVSFFALLPGAEFRLPSPPLPLLTLFYAVLLFFYVRRPVKLTRPAPLALFFLGAMLVLIVGTAAIRFFLRPKDPRITFIDVGQGDAALVEIPGKEPILIDAAGIAGEFDLGRAVVAPVLWQRGVDKLSLLLLSHPQLDHIGGASYLLDHFKVGEIWENGIERRAEFFEKFEEAARRNGSGRVVVSSGTSLSFGPCLLSVLYPVRKMGRGEIRKLNNSSVVVRLDCPAGSALFPGDLEEEGEQGLLDSGGDLSSAVLKVPHHGSRGAALPPFLDAVSPKFAIFSVGARNPYGHPAAEVEEAYRARGSILFRTDRDGAVAVILSESGIRARSWRSTLPEPIERIDPAAEWENFKRLFTPF